MAKRETEYLDLRGAMMRGTGSWMKSNNYLANWFVTPAKRVGTRPRFAWLEGLRRSLALLHLPTLNLPKTLGVYYRGIYTALSGATFKASWQIIFSTATSKFTLEYRSVSLFLSLLLAFSFFLYQDTVSWVVKERSRK